MMKEKRANMRVRVGAFLEAERMGRSQHEIAAAAGIAREHLSDLENDKKSPTLETFYAVCKALNVPPWTVLERAVGVDSEGVPAQTALSRSREKWTRASTR